VEKAAAAKAEAAAAAIEKDTRMVFPFSISGNAREHARQAEAIRRRYAAGPHSFEDSDHGEATPDDGEGDSPCYWLWTRRDHGRWRRVEVYATRDAADAAAAELAVAVKPGTGRLSFLVLCGDDAPADDAQPDMWTEWEE
jgi:hypothetical protein